MLNIYRWGTCWTPVMKTSHYSLLRPRLSDPFLNENQRDGKKNGRLVGKSLPLRSPPFHLFRFLSARSLGALFRQKGSDRTLRGDGVSGTERRRTKVLTPLLQSMNKTWPLFFRGAVPFATFWGENLFFFPPCSALFSCQLVENSFFFLVHSAPAAPV